MVPYGAPSGGFRGTALAVARAGAGWRRVATLGSFFAGTRAQRDFIP